MAAKRRTRMRLPSNTKHRCNVSRAGRGLVGLAVVTLALLLSGCGLPPAIMVASYAIEGFSLIATGKTITDHALSNAMQQDCALFRVVKGRQVCHEAVGAGGPPAMMASVSNGDNWAADAYAIRISPLTSFVRTAPARSR